MHYSTSTWSGSDLVIFPLLLMLSRPNSVNRPRVSGQRHACMSRIALYSFIATEHSLDLRSLALDPLFPRNAMLEPTHRSISATGPAALALGSAVGSAVGSVVGSETVTITTSEAVVSSLAASTFLA